LPRASSTFKLAESRNAMNTIRRYAADDAHVIYGTAYDESLGDQLRVTVIATGLSSSRRTESRTPPLTVVQQSQPVLRTGTDNLPILNQVAQRIPLGTRRRRAQDYSQADHPSVWRSAPQPGRGEGGCAGQQRHGRDRDPGVPARARPARGLARRADASASRAAFGRHGQGKRAFQNLSSKRLRRPGSYALNNSGTCMNPGDRG
jgi:hypothetical protein